MLVAAFSHLGFRLRFISLAAAQAVSTSVVFLESRASFVLFSRSLVCKKKQKRVCVMCVFVCVCVFSVSIRMFLLVIRVFVVATITLRGPFGRTAAFFYFHIFS